MCSESPYDPGKWILKIHVDQPPPSGALEVVFAEQQLEMIQPFGRAHDAPVRADYPATAGAGFEVPNPVEGQDDEAAPFGDDEAYRSGCGQSQAGGDPSGLLTPRPGRKKFHSGCAY